MTVDVSEQFLYLQQAAGDVSGNSLMTRCIGVQACGQDVRLGLDAFGLKHLLVPMSESTTVKDLDSAGVSLGKRELLVADSSHLYLDMHCRQPQLNLVFERLVEDVVTRLAADATTPVRTCRTALNEWRALLRAAGQTVARDVVIGLVGELEVLRLLAERDAALALATWRGPDAGVHDFACGGRVLEVKATSSVDGNFVSISNLDQLDPSLVERLDLVVVHVREDDTAPSLDERIDGLLQMGLDRQLLLEKVAEAGYVYEAGVTERDRYRVRSLHAWAVEEGFPGLRRSDLSEARAKGVSKVRYELALDSAPPRLSDEALRRLLDEWGK